MPTITKREFVCKVCKKVFHSTRTKAPYCGDDCRTEGMKRPSRPSCKVLMDAMVKHRIGTEVNWTAVGREFKTTSKTAHIWAEQYGLVPVKFYIGKVFY